MPRNPASPLNTPKPGPIAFTLQGGLQSDPYARMRRENPTAFYGQTLTKQYGGNTAALGSMFGAIGGDRQGINLAYQNGNNPTGGGVQNNGYQYGIAQPGYVNPNVVRGGGQQAPPGWAQGGQGAVPQGPNQWDPSQLWALLSQMFGRPVGVS